MPSASVAESSVVMGSPSSSTVSSVSGASTERATTATASPPLGVTNFTPIVERPVARKSSLMGLRTT